MVLIKPNPKISIIILNYNGSAITLKCLESLSKIAYKNVETIVVDNGSSDNSKENIQRTFPEVKIIRNLTNTGYAEGNNIGYRAAKGELILFLNNDTLVEKNFLKPLVKALLSNKKQGAVQPKIMNFPHAQIIDSIGSYITSTGFLYHFGHNKKDEKKYNFSEEIFSMKGACMLFKKEVLEKTGLFDHNYFAYFEETDLCQRVWLAGYRISYIPDSRIFHIGGETSKKMNYSFINYHSYKNRIYTYLKNFEVITILKILPLHIFLCMIAILIYIFTFRFEMAFSIFRAILWNIIQIQKLLYDRQKIAELRRVSDNDYLPQLLRKVRPSYFYHLFATALAGYRDTPLLIRAAKSKPV